MLPDRGSASRVDIGCGISAAAPQISVVVPVYKEAGNIQPFLARAVAVLRKMGVSYEIIFALDPSPDDTEKVILDAINQDPSIKLLVFSRRFGQPAATMAGILSCRGDTCVAIDVDLQDPPELIETMYGHLKQGYEVAYARRRSRKGETLVKRAVAYLGYALINRISDVRIPSNTGDFRIMTRRVIEELRRLNETHGFLRGLVAYVGFRQISVEYDRDQRYSGKGNYNRLVGSLKIGFNGIVSFSTRPLQLMSILGLLLCSFCFLSGAWSVAQKLIGLNLTPDLSATVLAVTFFSGVQLLGLGLMGEYVGRIYDEVKRRPLFILDKAINIETRPNPHTEQISPPDQSENPARSPSL